MKLLLVPQKTSPAKTQNGRPENSSPMMSSENAHGGSDVDAGREESDEEKANERDLKNWQAQVDAEKSHHDRRDQDQD